MAEWYHECNGHEHRQTLVTVKDREAWRAAVHGVTGVRHDWGTELMNSWTPERLNWTWTLERLNIWTLERQYWGTCLQDSSGDPGIENRLVETVRGEGGTDWKSNIEIYINILSYVKCIAGGNLLYDVGSANLVLCDDTVEWDGMGGEREVQDRGDICILMADSCCCMAESNIMW